MRLQVGDGRALAAVNALTIAVALLQFRKHGLRVRIAWIELQHSRIRFGGFNAVAASKECFCETVECIRRVGELADVQLEHANRVIVSLLVEQGVADAVQLRLGKVVACAGCRPQLLVERQGGINPMPVDFGQQPARNRKLWRLVGAVMKDVGDGVGYLETSTVALRQDDDGDAIAKPSPERPAALPSCPGATCKAVRLVA